MRTVQPARGVRSLGGMAQDGHDGRTAGSEPAAQAPPLGDEPAEMVGKASDVGSVRLHRPLLAEAVTAFIGGMSISFGGIAMALAGGIGHELGGEPLRRLLGALAFPVGFVILLVGKGELFTENFLLPVVGVLEKRAPARSLLRVWGVSLLFNLLGAALFAALIASPGVLHPSAAEDLVIVAGHKMSMGFGEALVRGLFAGWLMTVLTWLLLGTGTPGARLAIMWMIASLIVLGEFNHAVISSAEIFMAWTLGLTPDPARFLAGELIPATLGNLVGGVLFVTVLHYLQAHGVSGGPEKRRIRRRLAEHRRRRPDPPH